MSDSEDEAVDPKPEKTVQDLPVEDLLECTICLEVPASPIHVCANGHVICGLCADNVKKCGVCESEPLQVSILAERLSRQLEFKSKCPNYEAGCRNVIASAELKDHTPHCYYRNALCNERHGVVCKDVSIPFKNFPRHLKEDHKYKERLTVTRSGTVIDGKLREGTTWRLAITSKDDKYFLMHNYMGKDAVYFWVTVLADTEKSEEHSYELALEGTHGEREKIKSCWTMPVLPYHGGYSKFEDPPSPLFVTIPDKVFYEFCEEGEAEDGKKKYTFTLSYRILSAKM